MDKCVGVGGGDSCERLVKLVGYPYFYRLKLHTQGIGCWLHPLPGEGRERVGWIHEDGNTRDARHHRLEQFKPFAFQLTG